MLSEAEPEIFQKPNHILREIRANNIDRIFDGNSAGITNPAPKYI
jgi:hypothetical protein